MGPKLSVFLRLGFRLLAVPTQLNNSRLIEVVHNIHLEG